MWNSKMNFKLLTVFFLVTLVWIFVDYPIFMVESNTNSIRHITSITTDGKGDVFILQYLYTTGSGWTVINSTNESMINKEVVLYNAFDPRFLKDNKDFDLDYTSMLLVKANKTKDTVINGENSTLLFADEITIIFDTEKPHYSMSDMSLPGIVKSIIGVFNHKFRLSY